MGIKLFFQCDILDWRWQFEKNISIPYQKKFTNNSINKLKNIINLFKQIKNHSIHNYESLSGKMYL